MSDNNWNALCQWLREAYSKNKDINQLLDASIQSGWDIDSIELAIKNSLGLEIEPSRPTPFPEFGNNLNMNLGDRQVHILAMMKNPNLVIVENMLSDDECDLLIEISRPKLERSQVLEYETGIRKIGMERTSDGTFFKIGETELVSRIEQRIARFLNWPIEYGEGLQVLRYSEGQEFKPHHDYYSVKTANQRTATLLIYLNEPKQGGSTIFPDINMEILPKKGNAVFFTYSRPYAYTRTRHGGTPIYSGEKWVATKWLHGQTYEPIASNNYQELIMEPS